MNVREPIQQLQKMPGDAEVVVDGGRLGDDLWPATVELCDGPNSPAADWPLRPYVLIIWSSE